MTILEILALGAAGVYAVVMLYLFFADCVGGKK